MEVRIEGVEDQAVPEDTYIAFRIGSSQKQARFKDKRQFQFPDPGDDRRRFGRIEVFKRVGYKDVDFSNFDGQFDNIDVSCKDFDLPLMQLRVSVSGNGMVEEAPVKDAERTLKVRQRIDEAQRYMKEHQLDDVLSESLREVMRERPTNPHNALSNEIIRRSARLPLEVTVRPSEDGTGYPPLPQIEPVAEESAEKAPTDTAALRSLAKQTLLDATANGKLDASLSKMKESKAPADAEGEAPAPADTVEAPAPAAGEAAPAESGEVAAPAPEEAAPAESGEVAAPATEEAAPAESGEALAPAAEEAAPAESGEALAPAAEETAPAESGEVTAPAAEEAAPAESGEVTAPAAEEAAPAESGQEVAPAAEEAAPAESVEAVAPAAEESAPVEPGAAAAPAAEEAAPAEPGEATAPAAEKAAAAESGEVAPPAVEE